MNNYFLILSTLKDDKTLAYRYSITIMNYRSKPAKVSASMNIHIPLVDFTTWLLDQFIRKENIPMIVSFLNRIVQCAIKSNTKIESSHLDEVMEQLNILKERKELKYST
jgi:hypothetical protein